MTMFALRFLRSERGIGMVGAMLALGMLAVVALIAAGLAVNEHRSSFNDYVHDASLLAADSGGEAAIAWLRMNDRPPVIEDATTLRVKQTSLNAMLAANEQNFDYAVRMRPNPSNPALPLMMPRPGYDTERFMDFVYDVDANGHAAVEGQSNITIIVNKLNRIGN